MRQVRFRMRTPLHKSKLVWALAAAVAVVAALTLAWRHTALADIVTAENTVRWVETIDSYWWAPILVALVYLPASVVMFPRPLITLAAVAAFGPWEGFATAMSGILFNAAVAYYVGRLVDERRFKRLGGPRMERAVRMLKREGLWPVTAMFLLPIAPFAVECIAAGALRVKLWHVIVGAAIGNLPGVLLTTVLGHQVAGALIHGRQLDKWVVGVAIAAVVALAWGTRLFWKRFQAEVLQPAS